MKISCFLFSILILASSSFAENISSTEIENEPSNSPPLFWLGMNTIPTGVGVAAGGTAIIPLEAGIRIIGGLSLGPIATFSGKYRYQETDLSLTGLGVQAMWNFGQSAIADGFYLNGFYQHYTLSGTKMTTISNLGISIPLEGSLPIDSIGGGVGYQWVWKSGLRISAGIQVAYLKTDASGLNLMGMSGGDLSMLGAGMSSTPISQNINVPLIQNQSALIPMPELSIGWSI